MKKHMHQIIAGCTDPVEGTLHLDKSQTRALIRWLKKAEDPANHMRLMQEMTQIMAPLFKKVGHG